MVASTLVPPACEHDLDEPTLDQTIVRLWGRIMGARDVACPWCRGTMRPGFSAGPLPVGARCEDCGASLT